MPISGSVSYPGPGCVVEFLQDNKAVQAFVLEEQSGKLRLLLPNRRELSLQSTRILPWSGPHYQGERSRQEMIDLLKEHQARREAAAGRVDVLEIWSLAQGEMEKAGAAWLAELVLDSPDIDAVAGLGHALLGCKTHFRFQPPDFEIYPEERVHARMAEQELQHEREQLSVQGQAFFQTLWDIHTRRKQSLENKDLPPPELAEKLEQLLRALMADPDAHDAASLWAMLAKGLPQPVRDDPFAPLHLATAWGLVAPHHNIWFDRAAYAPDASWADAHSDEINDVLHTLQSTLTTLPALERPFFSVDAASTRDIDDAACIDPDQSGLPPGQLRLLVCIACPALVWPFDGPLDKAVQRRASSIYLPEATSHMLPEILGTDRLSLLAGQARPALALRLTVAADGSLVSTELQAVNVTLAANLSYTECERVLSDQATPDSPAQPFADDLRRMDELTQRLQERRIAGGAVNIDREEPNIVLHGDGNDISVELTPPAQTARSQRIVSEIMILSNSAIAAWAREHGIPLYHRTQDLAVPKEFAGSWKDPVDIARALRVLGPALLETTGKPHAALGVHEYAPSTSPLRRYPDLVNTAQLCRALETGEPRWEKHILDEHLLTLNVRLDAAGQVQRFRPRYWKLVHFKQQGDKRWWDAVITEENDMFATVALPQEQLILRVRRKMLEGRVAPGQAVRVRIGKVRPLYNEIQIVDAQEA